MKFVYGYTTDIPFNKYKCEVCKKVLSKSNKAKHMKLHNNIKLK